MEVEDGRDGRKSVKKAGCGVLLATKGSFNLGGLSCLNPGFGTVSGRPRDSFRTEELPQGPEVQDVVKRTEELFRTRVVGSPNSSSDDARSHRVRVD